MDPGFEIDLNIKNEIFTARALLKKTTLTQLAAPGSDRIILPEDILDEGDQILLVFGSTRYEGRLSGQQGNSFQVSPALTGNFPVGTEAFEMVTATYDVQDTNLFARRFLTIGRPPSESDVSAFFARIAVQEIDRRTQCFK